MEKGTKTRANRSTKMVYKERKAHIDNTLKVMGVPEPRGLMDKYLWRPYNRFQLYLILVFWSLILVWSAMAAGMWLTEGDYFFGLIMLAESIWLGHLSMQIFNSIIDRTLFWWIE